jgi:hypothetical protein
MNWELYEVWSVDVDGHESLVDTSKDLKKARQLAEESLTDEYVECIIYRENEDGELEEVEVIVKD